MLDPEALRRALLDGDVAAFETVVRERSDLLLRVAARVLGDAAEAEDVVHESSLRAYRALVAGRFDGRATLDTWLYRIVTYAALDALKARRRRDRRHEGLAPEVGHHNPVEERAALRELATLVDGLPPEQRVMLVLKQLEGLSTAQIAELFDTTVGAVEQRLVRARATLRAAIKETKDLP